MLVPNGSQQLDEVIHGTKQQDQSDFEANVTEPFFVFQVQCIRCGELSDSIFHGILQERDGVVAALRVQLRQRQAAMDAQQSASPALISASSIAAEEGAAFSNASRVGYIGNEPETYAPLLEELPGMSREASQLEAMWSTPSQLPRWVLPGSYTAS